MRQRSGVVLQADAGHGARGVRLLLERGRQQPPQTREVVSPLIHSDGLDAWAQKKKWGRNKTINVNKY